jgi:hypothetical protein
MGSLDDTVSSSIALVLISDITRRGLDFDEVAKLVKLMGPENEEEKLKHCDIMLTNFSQASCGHHPCHTNTGETL